MALSEAQIHRYARHILLPDVGGAGQARLLAARVAVPVGPERPANVVALAYLAAAGVGTLVVTGPAEQPPTDRELASGIVYGAADRGRPRIEALRERLRQQNPDVTVVAGTAADGDALLDCGERSTGDAYAVADALRDGGDRAATLLARLARGT